MALIPSEFMCECCHGVCARDRQNRTLLELFKATLQMGVNAERVWRDNREEGRKTEKRKDIEKDTARAPARGRKQEKENQDFCAPYESTKYFLLCRESKKDVLPAREIA